MAEPYVGIPAADRQKVAVLSEVSQAVGRAARAVTSDPALGRLIAERAPAVAQLVPDIIRVAMGTLAPVICDQYEADLAAARKDLANLQAVAARYHVDAEAELARRTAERDRAVRDADRAGEIRHATWVQAQQLRGELAVALERAALAEVPRG